VPSKTYRIALPTSFQRKNPMTLFNEQHVYRGAHLKVVNKSDCHDYNSYMNNERHAAKCNSDVE